MSASTTRVVPGMEIDFADARNDHYERAKEYHGFCRFRVTTKIFDGTYQYQSDIIEPLTPNDMVNDFHLVLPKRHSEFATHNICINLYDLPSHLWQYVRLPLSIKSNNPPEYYQPIIDRIFTYNVKISSFDGELQKLHSLLLSANLNRQQIIQVQQLYDNLVQKSVKGWIMTRTHSILNNYME
jgi:hypothetical protein